jgi:cell division protein FtsZ
MEELSQRLPASVRLFFGAVVDPLLVGSATVTLLAGACAGLPVQVRAHAVSVPEAPEPMPVLPLESLQEWKSEEDPSAPLDAEVNVPEFEGAEARAEIDSSEQAEPVADSNPSTPPQEPPATPEPEPAAPQGGGLRPRTSPDLRRDIGASFLKRRLLARNAEATARAEEAQLAQNPARVRQSIQSPEAAAPTEVESQVAPQKMVDAPAPKPPQGDLTSGLGDQRGAGSAASTHVAKSKSTVQEQMRFEPVSRGRFEKTDPTVVDGQDLDVPTFLRRRISLSNDVSGSSQGH